MPKIQTDICVSKKDLGKNLYRKKTYYTLVLEQDVLASNKEEAETKFMDQGGINHDMINQTLGETGPDVENYYADANYTDSENVEYIGKVAYDPWDDDSKENEDIDITDYYNEEDNADADDEYQQERANHIAKSMDRGEL